MLFRSRGVALLKVTNEEWRGAPVLGMTNEERAVVAQLDRATGYELVGWGFESLRPRHSSGVTPRGLLAAATVAALAGSCYTAVSNQVAMRVRLGSSMVEQGTHKPLAVGSSTTRAINE